MKIAYNPITETALQSAPSNDIIFDLKGLNIFAKGVKFKGTDTTYSVFKKHTSSSGGGYNGLVPVPSYITSNNRYLREDGTWLVPSNQYTYSLLNNTDLDTLKTEGKWYYISGGSNNTNGPENFNSGSELYIGRNASGYRYLKVITLDGKIWTRIYDSLSWGSWTRWYTDANTDTKVLLSSTTTSNYRPLILGYLNSTDIQSLANSTTNLVYTTTKLYALPSTGYLWATKLYSGGKEVLTSHLSLSNYVTINTAQTITGAKTFTGSIYVPSGHIYGVNESGGGILFFDGTRTIVGSIGESTTSATHIRSKTGHITVGTSNDVLYNILDSGNSVYGASTTSLPIYTPLKINGTIKNISLHGHKHTISDITNFSHTHTSNLITALTGYSKATSVASLNTSDSLNTALGKLEYKLGIAYDLVATANDNDGTIENLKEVLDVLQGIKDTDTIQALLGKYLPLTGGTITGNLTVKGQLNANSDIKITNNGSIHWNNATWQLRILITDDSSSGTPVFNFQQSSNSGSSWSALALIYDNGTVHSNGYVKSGSSDSYILLGGGGHKAVGDFATSSSLGNYLPLTGGTMKGNITISTDSYILWNRNTDYAKIHFKNDSDSDSDSYLGFETGDNGNEYFKFSAKSGSTTTELLSIKYDALRFRGTVVSLNGHTHDDRYPTKTGDGASGTWGININGYSKYIIGDRTLLISVSGYSAVGEYDGDTGFSQWAFGTTRNTLRGYLSILKPSVNILGLAAHGTILALGNGDTHMFIGVNYSNAILRIGAGNGDKLNWLKSVAFTDSNVASATKVNVTLHNTNNTNYPIVWSNENNTNSGNSSLYKSWYDLYYNPSSKRLTAAGGFIKGGSSDSYLLLGGGGHKAVSDFASSSSLNNYVTLTTNQTISGIKTFSTLLKFTVANGTAPFTVSSNTLVTNLNADLLDGYHIVDSYAYSSYIYKSINPQTDLYIKITTNISWSSQKYRFLLTANYDNIQGKLFLEVDTAGASTQINYYCTNYNGSNIVGVTRTFENARLVLYLKLRLSSSTTSATVECFSPSSGTMEIEQSTTVSFITVTPGIYRGLYLGRFVKEGSSDSYVLLGGGGHTLLSSLNGSHNHDDRYVNITGDTMTGNLSFSDTGTSSYPIESKGISWSGGTDGASIFYRLLASDLGNLVFRTTDDTNCYFIWENKTGSGTTLWMSLKGSTLTVSNLNGNASTASKLQTARTLWGLSFDGSANVSGTMSNVPTIINENYVHRFEIGRPNFNHWDFYEHGGTFNFYKCLDATGLSKTLLFNISPIHTYVLGNLGVGTTSPSLRLHVSGNVLSSGFMKSGSSDSYLLLGGGGHKAISDFMLKSDELSNNITTVTKSINVTTSWTDTGITGSDLATGTYIILLNADFNGTGSLWYCYFSGIMSWFSSNTNDSEADEILLHRAGHAYHNTLYLRTVQTTNGNGGMKLLIAASNSIGSTQNYTFKFKRII